MPRGVAWRNEKATSEQAVVAIAKRYHELVDLVERAPRVCLLNSQITPGRIMVPERRPDTCS